MAYANNMVRPLKCRLIKDLPEINCFKPLGIPVTEIEEVNLTLDEYQAIKLVDYEGLYQEDAAKEMNVSRQTIGNIIVSAHYKIAECLVGRKSLKIEGGRIIMDTERTFECVDCGHKWSIPYGTEKSEKCPACSSTNFHRAGIDNSKRGKCFRHGQNK